MERSDHAGHVLQRRTLRAALGKRSRRLTFKIDDGKIFAGVEHLAEMVIAMTANVLGRNLFANNGVEPLQDLLLALQQSMSQRLRVGQQMVGPLSQ